uniref:PHD-type domain-containing protein n=1 Tax=Romanomermis culicivorax TaxID=13658 RepID=A0A915HQ02_ROMCU
MSGVTNGDDQSIAADASSSSSNVKTKRKFKRRKKNQQQKGGLFDKEDQDWEENIKRRLKLDKKDNATTDSASVGRSNEISVAAVKICAGGKPQIINPDSYDRVIKRIDDSQMNKVQKPPDDFPTLEGKYVCCLCQKPSMERSLGDLFGPYYVKINKNDHHFWPPFLSKTSSTLNEKVKKFEFFYTDLWIHGFCALWTSGFYAKGNQLCGLNEFLGDYWQQKCVVCSLTGASIGCFVKNCKKAYHFVCADSAGCVLKEETMTLYCQIHKKLSA